MGRKKIEMRYIYDQKDRAVKTHNQVTFMKRKHGLLKKAAELSILCGLKVSLVFSDIQPGVFHVFSNDCAHKVDYEAFLKDNFIKEKSTFHEYSIFDYPFESVGDQESRVIVEPLAERRDFGGFMIKSKLGDFDKKDTNLKKREPMKGSTKAGSLLKSTGQVPIVLTFDAGDKIKQEAKTTISEPKFLPQAPLVENPSYKYKFIGLEGVSTDQKFIADSFLTDLDTKLKGHLEDIEKKGHTDEDSIVLLMTRCFLRKYLGFSYESRLEEHMIELLRSLIDFNSMLNCIQTLRDQIPSNDLFLFKLKQFNNLLINALVDPANFDSSSLTSLRGGKSIEPIVSFFVRSLLQQVRLLDSMYSGEKSAPGDLGSFITLDNHHYVDRLLASVFNLVACQRGKFALSSTPVKKALFQAKSEISVPEMTPKDGKPVNFFGVNQEKFLDRDRKAVLPSFLQQPRA